MTATYPKTETDPVAEGDLTLEEAARAAADAALDARLDTLEAATVSDASATVKGVSKLSVAPASPTAPIAAGTNDPRMTDARTPTAHTHPESEVTGLVADLAAKALATDLTAEASTRGSADTALGTRATNLEATAPTTGQKNALAGTQGTPGSLNQYVTTQDSRNSDARIPTAHASSHQPGGSDAMAVDAAAATGSLRTLGTSATSAAAGSDARLSDARTPTDGSVTNAKVDAAAAIAESKLNLTSDAAAATASRRTLGTGATQAAAGNDSRLSDTRIPTDGSVTNAKVDAAAAIAYSKLNLSASIVNGDIGAAAAIAYSKLSLAASVVNGDIAAAAGIAYSKLSLSGSIVAGDMAASLKPSGSAAAGTEALRALGTTASTAAAGNDSRLSDVRTPTAHHTSHEPGGSDAITSLQAGLAWRQPADYGLLAFNFPPALINVVGGSNGAGIWHITREIIPVATTVATVKMWLAVAGVTFTANRNFVALWSLSGTLIAWAAEATCTTAWGTLPGAGATPGVVSVTLDNVIGGQSLALAAGSYYVGFSSFASGTQPSFGRVTLASGAASWSRTAAQGRDVSVTAAVAANTPPSTVSPMPALAEDTKLFCMGLT